MIKRKDFDFYQHVYEILKQRFRSSFIPYHEVYSYLGRRFCLKKWEVKDLLKSMKGTGYLKMKKRGIILIEQNRGKVKQKEVRSASGKQNNLRGCP